ncbi:MAG TPA: hypothetical protein VFQ38_03505 [Longimicrobiales bacterium]|nr:hypothetical protein [Longimicrobiales bacterium]
MTRLPAVRIVAAMENAAEPGPMPPQAAESASGETQPSAAIDEPAGESPARADRPVPTKRFLVRADELDAYADAHLELVLLVGLGGVLLGVAWSCLLVLLIGHPPARAVPLFRAVTIASFVLLAAVVGLASFPLLTQLRIKRRWQRGVRRRRGQERPPSAVG